MQKVLSAFPRSVASLLITLFSSYGTFPSSAIHVILVFFFLLDLLQRLVQILDTVFRAVNGFYICSVFLSASHLLLASSVAVIM